MEQDACPVRRVTQQAQHEEQQAQALTRTLPLVLDDLRNPGTQVAYCASVPQDLGSKSDRLCIISIRGLRDPHTALPRDRPARSAYSHDTDDAECVLHPHAWLLIDIEDRREAGRATAARGLTVPPVRAGESDVRAITATEEGRLDRVCGQSRGFARRAPGIDGVVVYALAYEDLEKQDISVCFV